MNEDRGYVKIPRERLTSRFIADPTPGQVRQDACYAYVMAMLSARSRALLNFTIDKIASKVGVSWANARTAIEWALSDSARMDPSPFLDEVRRALLEKTRGAPKKVQSYPKDLSEEYHGAVSSVTADSSETAEGESKNCSSGVSERAVDEPSALTCAGGDRSTPRSEIDIPDAAYNQQPASMGVGMPREDEPPHPADEPEAFPEAVAPEAHPPVVVPIAAETVKPAPAPEPAAPIAAAPPKPSRPRGYRGTPPEAIVVEHKDFHIARSLDALSQAVTVAKYNGFSVDPAFWLEKLAKTYPDVDLAAVFEVAEMTAFSKPDFYCETPTVHMQNWVKNAQADIAAGRNLHLRRQPDPAKTPSKPAAPTFRERNPLTWEQIVARRDIETRWIAEEWERRKAAYQEAMGDLYEPDPDTEPTGIDRPTRADFLASEEYRRWKSATSTGASSNAAA